MMRTPSWIAMTFVALAVVPACDRDRPTRSGDAGRAARPGKIGGSMILATTTSTRDSGLLDVLVPLFEERTGVKVKVIAVGTGAALRMARRGDADAVLVHAPEAEQTLVRDGQLISGKRVMHNDFVLVGPADDPAGLRRARDLADAMRRRRIEPRLVPQGELSLVGPFAAGC
jgi:tungstate transport system substrate-binding protein